MLFLRLFFKFEIFEKKKKRERKGTTSKNTKKNTQKRKPTDKCEEWAIVKDSWLGVFRVNEMENKKAEFRGRG